MGRYIFIKGVSERGNNSKIIVCVVYTENSIWSYFIDKIKCFYPQWKNRMKNPQKNWDWDVSVHGVMDLDRECLCAVCLFIEWRWCSSLSQCLDLCACVSFGS